MTEAVLEYAPLSKLSAEEEIRAWYFGTGAPPTPSVFAWGVEFTNRFGVWEKSRNTGVVDKFDDYCQRMHRHFTKLTKLDFAPSQASVCVDNPYMAFPSLAARVRVKRYRCLRNRSEWLYAPAEWLKITGGVMRVEAPVALVPWIYAGAAYLRTPTKLFRSHAEAYNWCVSFPEARDFAE